MAELTTENIKKETNSLQQEVITPKRELVLHALDKEIDSILSDRKRPGWTIWAILGGVATVVWLLFDVFEEKQISFKSVSILYLIFSMLLESVINFSLTLSTSETYSRKKSRRFFLSNQIFGSNRMELFISLIRAISLLSIAVYYSNNVWWPKVFYVSLFNGLAALLFLMIIILGFLKLPMSSPLIKLYWYHSLIHLFVLGISIWSLTGYYSLISINTTISEYRISGLLIAATYLIIMLSQGTQNSPILNSLYEIRRDLCFNKIDLNTAIYQIDIALAGMQFDDIVQEDVSDTLHLLDKINEEYQASLKKIEVVQSMLPKNTLELSNEQKVIFQTVLESHSQSVKNIDKLFKALDLRFEKILKHIKWIRRISTSRDSEDSIKNVIEKIQFANKKAKEKGFEVRQKIDFLSKFNFS